MFTVGYALKLSNSPHNNNYTGVAPLLSAVFNASSPKLMNHLSLPHVYNINSHTDVTVKTFPCLVVYLTPERRREHATPV